MSVILLQVGPNLHRPSRRRMPNVHPIRNIVICKI